jgi:hypothetical protein
MPKVIKVSVEEFRSGREYLTLQNMEFKKIALPELFLPSWIRIHGPDLIRHNPDPVLQNYNKGM